MGAVKKSGFNIDELPEFDSSLSESWWERKNARHSELIEQKRQNENEEWWRKYNQYLHSQAWYDIRKRVLERDGHLCQACLKNKATQAHHLSYSLYEQFGFSAAFELVAVCYKCHCKIHPHLAEAQHELSEAMHNPYLNGGQSNGHR